MPDLREMGQNGPHGANNLLTTAEASAKLQSGEITSVQLVEDCLTRIADREASVHAWDYLDPEAALSQARARDLEPRRSALHGIPVGIKDIFDTCDMPTAYGSSIYANHQPANDSAVVALLRRAGAVILGKCATTEFASPVLAATRNPHDLTRSPGVSSSGSAAAVADFMAPLTVGSQTGGSTILPAAFCGVVGYKASLTGLDRGGIRHLRPTLDTLGLFARAIEDIAIARTVLSGGPGLAAVPGKPRIGVCRTLSWTEAAAESRAALEAADNQLASAGALVSDAKLPKSFEGIEQSFRVISAVEGSRALSAETRDHLARLNPWIQAGYANSLKLDQEQFDQAQLHAIECQRALAGLFANHDVLITPATSGEATAELAAFSNSAFNRLWTLMHVPCVTIPAFTGPNGMPVGLQIVGPIGADDRTLAIAQWIAGKL